MNIIIPSKLFGEATTESPPSQPRYRLIYVLFCLFYDNSESSHGLVEKSKKRGCWKDTYPCSAANLCTYYNIWQGI